MSGNEPIMVDHDFGDNHRGGVNLLKMALMSLQGRWHWAILLGLVLGGGLAAGGYWYGKQNIMYSSQGIVRIVPSRPQILYETELNQRLPEYDSYRSLQARLLESQRILEWAIESDDMRRIGWPEGRVGLQLLFDSLRVSVPRSEDVLLVRVTHENPVIAQQAVNAVLKSYERLSGDGAAQQFRSLENELTNLHETYRRQREAARTLMLQLAEQVGTDNPARRREAFGIEIDRLDRQIAGLWAAVTGLPGSADQTEADPSAVESAEQSEADPSAVESAEPSNDILSQYDAQLASLINRQQSLEIEIRANSDQLGAEHPQMQSLARDLKIVSALVDDRAQKVRERLGSDELSGVTANAGLRSRSTIESQIAELEETRKNLDAQVLKLGRIQLQIDLEKQKAAEANDSLAETSRRLEALRVEQGDRQFGRVEITQFGERPLRPTGDDKKKFAALGGVAGGGLGVMLVMLPGLLAPKYRSVGQLSVPSSMYSVLGVMPELDSAGAVGDELARLNLHQIRVLLEASKTQTGNENGSYLFTSATAGEGKTSLVLALSSAYANAGMSVAIVDADLVGRAVTGQLVSPELDGVLQWLRNHDLTAEPPVHSTPIPGVYLVPHGRDNGLEPESLGAKHLKAMLESLKQRFDVVLVDSGPILGSTEAAAAASVCDETVLVIGRGQRESLVKAARDRLERLGARRVGLVFNRADREDLERHPTSATSLSVSKRSRASGGAPRSLALSLAMQVSSDRGA